MNPWEGTTALPNSRDIFLWLRFQIAAGRFGNGKGLPGVDALSERLGVSAKTVREVYQMLGRDAGDGIGASRPSYREGLGAAAQVSDRFTGAGRA